MIPYYELGNLFTVPIINRPVNIFGVMLVLGIFTAMGIANARAKKDGKADLDILSNMYTVVLVSGFIGAHLFDNFFYHFDKVIENPFIIFNLWSGISSFGGIFGGVLSGIVYIYIKKLDFWDYAEPVIYTMPFGWFFGRIGCASVHDHIGSKTDFFLGINFPGDMGVRHDLGLYEAIFHFFLCLLLLALYNKDFRKGTYTMIICLLYGPVRFFLDSLRATDLAHNDIRYFGLTPGQYSSIALILLGLFLFYKIYIKDKGKAKLNV